MVVVSACTISSGMDLNLKGRLALITGSTAGLGKSIATALAREGAEVIINGRYKKTVLETMKEISDKYRVRTWACPVDVTNNQAIVKFFKNGPVATRGSLDILVNNVGNIKKLGKLNDFDDEEWLECYDVTFMSVLRFTRAAIELLSASGHGRIINISSLASLQPGKHHHPYVAAKAAVNVFTKQTANDLASKNILVNAICPSTLYVENWPEEIKNHASKNNTAIEEAEKIMLPEESSKSPLGRICKKEEVADLVTFLASDKSGFITGNIIKIDGGISK